MASLQKVAGLYNIPSIRIVDYAGLIIPDELNVNLGVASILFVLFVSLCLWRKSIGRVFDYNRSIGVRKLKAIR